MTIRPHGRSVQNTVFIPYFDIALGRQVNSFADRWRGMKEMDCQCPGQGGDRRAEVAGAIGTTSSVVIGAVRRDDPFELPLRTRTILLSQACFDGFRGGAPSRRALRTQPGAGGTHPRDAARATARLHHEGRMIIELMRPKNRDDLIGLSELPDLDWRRVREERRSELFEYAGHRDPDAR